MTQFSGVTSNPPPLSSPFRRVHPPGYPILCLLINYISLSNNFMPPAGFVPILNDRFFAVDPVLLSLRMSFPDFTPSSETFIKCQSSKVIFFSVAAFPARATPRKKDNRARSFHIPSCLHVILNGFPLLFKSLCVYSIGLSGLSPL